MPGTRTRIPVEPLIAYVQKTYGSVSHLPGLGVHSSFFDEDGTERPAVDRTPAETARRNRVKQILARAQRTGGVTTAVADWFACDVLSVHPTAIWGSTWYELSMPPVEQAELAPVIPIPTPLMRATVVEEVAA